MAQVVRVETRLTYGLGSNDLLTSLWLPKLAKTDLSESLMKCGVLYCVERLAMNYAYISYFLIFMETRENHARLNVS